MHPSIIASSPSPLAIRRLKTSMYANASPFFPFVPFSTPPHRARARDRRSAKNEKLNTKTVRPPRRPTKISTRTPENIHVALFTHTHPPIRSEVPRARCLGTRARSTAPPAAARGAPATRATRPRAARTPETRIRALEASRTRRTRTRTREEIARDASIFRRARRGSRCRRPKRRVGASRAISRDDRRRDARALGRGGDDETGGRRAGEF